LGAEIADERLDGDRARVLLRPGRCDDLKGHVRSDGLAQPEDQWSPRHEFPKLEEVRLRLLRVLVLDVQEILSRRELIEVPEASGRIDTSQLEGRCLASPPELSVDVDGGRLTLAEHDRPRHSGPQAYPLVLDRRPVRGLESELEGVEQVEEQRLLAAVGEAKA